MICGTAPSPAANDFSFSSACVSCPLLGVNNHGRPVNMSGRACSMPPRAAPPSGCPPMNVNRSGSDRAASTIARFVLPVSVMTAEPATLSASSRRNLEVLLNRRRENHEIRFRQHDRIVGRDVDGMKHHRALEHVLAIYADDEPGRPDLPRRQRDRSADQSQSDDPDALKDRRLSGLRPGCSTGSCRPSDTAQLPRSSNLPISNLPILTGPSRASRPARRRCCGRSPAR